uniref:Chromosome-associated kinesin KIF4-like isoform X1 n=1 Tax=Saccoglossus kowalevskii TaxID=10224 RepID=A0ABM0GV04_SACKO|nr:PREDICTED: chromosome-associated kinesin KIF4-like isoform X1 [Saccoglossus kowalevskii]
MIACVSPADSNLEETINTLRYADRARQIKNKPIVNRDPTQAELSRLRQQVQQLQVQLLNKGGVVGDGVGLSGDSSANVKVLVEKNKALESENRKLSSELQSSVDQTTHMCEKAIMAEMSRDKLKQRLDEIKEHVAPNLEVLNSLGNETENENILEKLKAVKEIQKMILELDEEESEVCNDDLMLPAEGMEDDENATPLDKELLLRRAEMGRQLQELNNALAMKQELASAMGESDEKMSSMKVQYEETMKQLESEITSLQQEKDELAKALHEVKNNTVVSKISEQRRRRLQELEGEMSKLKKKLAEHSKLIKFKEQGDQKIKKLNSEIQVMKQTRVKLMKQMKQDTTKFQQFKTQKDREVMKLKQQDRKRQHEVVKLERQNQLQQNMLRRKAEEASAANKRLKEALHKRKIATDKKEESFAQSDMKGTGQRVRNWLSRELEVLVCMGESRRHLEELLADRKTLSQQLSELEQSTDEPAAKKRASMNDTFVCDDSLSSSDCGDEEKKQKIFALKHELQLRSAQIADLQEKLMDADQEEKSKHRWSNIRSIVEAKCGLKWLLNTLVESKVQNTFTEAELTDSKVAQNECRKEVEEMKDDMENIRLQHQQEITELQKMNEDKVLYLLKELNQDANTLQDTDDSEVRSLKERLQFQESQIAELNAIHEKFQQVSAENELLKKQLAVAKYQKDRKLSFLPELTDQSSVSDMKTVKNPTKIKKKKAEVLDDIFESEDESWESDEDDSEYTYESDSSWCETPIKPKQRRRTKIIDQNKKQSLLKVPTGCSCKGNCRGRCGCTKSGRECDDTCRCDDTKCLNKDGRRNSGGDNSDNDLSMQSMSQSQLSSTSSICLNSTFLASPDNPNENKPESPRKALKDVNTGLSADPKNIKESGDGALKKESFKKPGIFVKRPKPDDESAINSQGVISKKKRKLLSTSNKSYFKPPQV